MRTFRSASIVFGICCAALLAGCSVPLNSPESTPGSAAGVTSWYRSGIAPKAIDAFRVARMRGRVQRPSKARKDLFVADIVNDAVYIFARRAWQNTGSITDGIGDPDGEFVDKKGNLYVADFGNVAIEEYGKGASAPSFVYNAGMIDPVDVTVDRHGNVFEADFDDEGGDGFVATYKQGTNEADAKCYPGGSVEDVAIDASDNVFVSLNFKSGAAGIVEYPHGLKGCMATTLGISLTYAGGLAIDRHGNLLAVDQVASSIEVIAPPYSSITGAFGYGFIAPYHITIDNQNNQIYLSDIGHSAIDVLSYPSGKSLAQLNATQGLAFPVSAVDGQNYIP
jgi:hypothetical protein